MSDVNTVPQVPVEAENTKPGILTNRKHRRHMAALKRKAPVKRREWNYWFKRIVNEMAESKAVQEKVVSGKLDKYLE